MTADTGADDDVAGDATDAENLRSDGGDVRGEGGDPSDRRSTADAGATAGPEASTDGGTSAATGGDAGATAVDSDERAVDESADADEIDDLEAEVDELRQELDALETRIDEKTVHRDEIRSELRRYVRKRQRRGHATGWGPYLVLLYGTAMTLAAFFYLGDVAAVFAMFVIWLSTLGLYVLMVILGSFVAAGKKLAGMRDLIGKLRG